MRTIQVRVIGDPKAQPRPRAVNRGRHAGVYNPTTADAWKIQVKAAFQRYNGLNIQGPVRCNLEFYFARPKRLLRKLDPAGAIPHICKPDKDNLDKSVFDALSNIKFWGDDCQVYAGKTEKYYAPKGGDAGMVATITYREFE